MPGVVLAMVLLLGSQVSAVRAKRTLPASALEPPRDQRHPDPRSAQTGRALPGRARPLEWQRPRTAGALGTRRRPTSLETLREILRACGFDLESNLVPYQPDKQQDAQL